MVIRQCDRCGKAYKPYRDNGKHKIVPGVNGIAFVHIDQKGEYDGGKTDTYDLCPVCWDAVYRFLHECSQGSLTAAIPPELEGLYKDFVGGSI